MVKKYLSQALVHCRRRMARLGEFMNAKEDARSAIAQEAADWFVANRAGLTAQERQSFTAWLKASPVHIEEYLALSVMAVICARPAKHLRARLMTFWGAHGMRYRAPSSPLAAPSRRSADTFAALATRRDHGGGNRRGESWLVGVVEPETQRERSGPRSCYSAAL